MDSIKDLGILFDTRLNFKDHIQEKINKAYHHHHHLFAQNTIKIDNGYVNEQDRKAHCALTSAHNIT